MVFIKTSSDPSFPHTGKPKSTASSPAFVAKAEWSILLLLPIPPECAEDVCNKQSIPRILEINLRSWNCTFKMSNMESDWGFIWKRVRKVEIKTNKGRNSFKVKWGWCFSLWSTGWSSNPVHGTHNCIHLHKSGHQCQSSLTEQFTSALNSNICACLWKSNSWTNSHCINFLVQGLGQLSMHKK